MKKYILISVAVIILIITFNLIGIYNYGNRAMKGIEYAWKENQNIYSSFTNKVIESTQVPKMYKKDVEEVIKATLAGRYGKEGAKAQILLLKEDNPKLSPELYTAIQRTIEAGRSDFENAQKLLLDRKRSFETVLLTFPKGMLLKMFGFNEERLEKYSIIVNEKTKEAFDKKIDEPLTIQ